VKEGNSGLECTSNNQVLKIVLNFGAAGACCSVIQRPKKYAMLCGNKVKAFDFMLKTVKSS